MPDALYIAGPTASGKSALALELAEQLGGEIISVDSMQVYRGLDIGTAKPSLAERARVPHHLIDVLGLNEPCDAARFLQLARAAEKEILSRGQTPIFCGGTGLYFNVLAYGLGEAPPASAALRAELNGLPLATLLAEIAERDPAAWQTLDRQNPRRVMRAVEMLRLSGRPLADQRGAWQGAPSGCWLGLERDRVDLHQRIEKRVNQMFQDGWVEETSRLLAQGLAENAHALQAIGYRQIIEHLAGKPSLAETIGLVKQKTRQYAKRQMTWFRRQLPLHWLAAPPDEPLPALAARAISRVRERNNCAPFCPTA